MADQSEKPEAAASVAGAHEAPAKSSESANQTPAKSDGENKEDATSTDESKTTDNKEVSAKSASDKSAADGDAEMKDAPEAQTEEAAAEGSVPFGDGETKAANAAAETPAGKGKGRRKSAAGEAKGKTLNRKGSKVRLTHTDAKPGDHFLVKLKGFPAWPAVICDESMLPSALVNTRPVSARRADGTFSEAFADGGKRVNDRSFPVMYLHTNEFGWAPNTQLTELTPEKAEETITEKMRKDLKEAFQLATKNHPIEHYKEILSKFHEELIAQEEAKKEALATPKKGKKGKSKAVDEDVEMADADDAEEKPRSKKRKADEDVSTPQRSDSVKKPKIKLNTSTPKANGTPKNKDESVTKSKSKSKKASDKEKKEALKEKEAKLTPEERRNRKEKEVLYLRHKLQRGLLTRDQQPQESEMKQMSEYITMLETFHELEVSIIRATKINKVLKAILKLESIPREEEFHFKDRSQTLLDKWNKLISGDSSSTPATNGVNGKSDEKKAEANGVKEDSEESKKDEPSKTEAAETASEAPEGDEKPASEDKVSAPPEPVEASA